MRYFDYLSDDDLETLFFQPPAAFSKHTARALLRKAVGGLLYIPAASTRIAQIILGGMVRGLTAMAICLEDSVDDTQRDVCVDNMKRQLAQLVNALAGGSLPEERLPLLFVRVKDVVMLESLADFFAAHSTVLTGVILPKTTADSLAQALPLTAEIARRAAGPFYIMPILEADELTLCHDQSALLHTLRETTDRYYELVLNIRMGATDLCGLYGIRRSMETPVYSIALMSGIIGGIVREFGLGDRYTISGPVWEYYSSPAHARATRRHDEVDGLLRETSLDLQNGLLGKTCVHPTQLLPVQASYVVPYEAFQDAQGILSDGRACGGVQASARRNKMNELRPHTLWAQKIIQQAEIYGVYQEDMTRKGFLRAVGEAT